MFKEKDWWKIFSVNKVCITYMKLLGTPVFLNSRFFRFWNSNVCIYIIASREVLCSQALIFLQWNMQLFIFSKMHKVGSFISFEVTFCC